MNKKIIALTVIIFLCFFGYFFFAPGNTQNFLAAYHAYDIASTAEENAAHIPGNGGNAPRQKLNEILSRVLTAEILPEERQKLSEEGLVLAKELHTQIDAIGEEGKKTQIAFETLRTASKNMGGFFAQQKTKKIIAFAEDRSRTIKEVEEISYGINTRLENIFHGIIADRGVLTSERINTLNQALPEAEKQFDRLTENYRTLDEIEKEINTVFQGLPK